jgi:hypothetical protein
MLMICVGAEEQQVGITGDGFAFLRSDLRNELLWQCVGVFVPYAHVRSHTHTHLG